MNSAQTKYTKPGKDPAMKTSHAAMFASLLAAAIFAVGCGSKSAPVPPPPTGGTEGLAVFMKDAPADSVLSLQVTIASIRNSYHLFRERGQARRLPASNPGPPVPAQP